MIISHKYKLIFIHIQKCAGTSITYALNPYLPEDDIVLGCTPKGEKLSKIWGPTKGIYKHATALKAKEVLGEEIWDNYFKFSFIRNPWDLVVSTYHWWLKTSWDDDKNTGAKIRQMNSFEEYVKSPYLRSHTCSQALMDGTQNSLVDFIGKYESLEKDFAYVCGRVGLPNIELPAKNISEHKGYQEYYDQTTKEIVKKRFKWDIKNFTYSFE
ncbi:MAG: sulfotransferase family 2 domain-containing protein [Gomphosphaeria aponina SAG 52.96 = DSM 107014]|uniref:Sulfotransferase family 2 domain-containing protein n=1 Tax=Gomphosphaeria aponina SAG 52.96 = DSM 107014 TaxID=1521640 RepID=A0A941JSC7_9CHRO|nr:sulfotransferase family 2 domain-containing protein [Gomphosphaeria aponina SAG 52.96 = DSM 107014]